MMMLTISCRDAKEVWTHRFSIGSRAVEDLIQVLFVSGHQQLEQLHILFRNSCEDKLAMLLFGSFSQFGQKRRRLELVEKGQNGETNLFGGGDLCNVIYIFTCNGKYDPYPQIA